MFSLIESFVLHIIQEIIEQVHHVYILCICWQLHLLLRNLKYNNETKYTLLLVKAQLRADW